MKPKQYDAVVASSLKEAQEALGKTDLPKIGPVEMLSGRFLYAWGREPETDHKPESDENLVFKRVRYVFKRFKDMGRELPYMRAVCTEISALIKRVEALESEAHPAIDPSLETCVRDLEARVDPPLGKRHSVQWQGVLDSRVRPGHGFPKKPEVVRSPFAFAPGWCYVGVDGVFRSARAVREVLSEAFAAAYAQASSEAACKVCGHLPCLGPYGEPK